MTNPLVKSQKIVSAFLSVLLLTICTTSYANDITQLDNKARASQQIEKQHNISRESSSKQTKLQLQAALNQLEKKRQKVETQNRRLAEQFSLNEKSLAEKEQQLQLETGSLGEMFGVVRQVAKEVDVDLKLSLATIEQAGLIAAVKQVISTDALPSLELLSSLWKTMEQQIRASGEIVAVDFDYIDGNGSQAIKQGLRLGDIALVGSQGYLNWNSEQGKATDFLAQPAGMPTAASITSASTLLLDPTRGQLLAQFEFQPTIQQRIEQGGVVGSIIIALLVIGLLIALYRGAVLLKIQTQISKQLKNPDRITDNPLGRILNVFKSEKKQTIESLELRLLESIIDEQQGLEQGLSMLKLMAAIAPMLGLLGTVTGMIETFQVITEFGNSDPKVMAGGISMALMTTVLGLVAAMPLLLAHNLLSSRAEAIKGTLEKQSVSLVAERAEAIL
ncbi:MAG: MotA/TolQ/ExbB proton channel family protein [Aliivibrio sp.]|nr:MotA/TolQ/ExbB proton channel family protein [Aliivibrio sp.]